MNYLFTKIVVLFVFVFFNSNKSLAEGFTAGTLVKVPDGYVKIEDLHVGNYVICYDADKNPVESKIVHIFKKSIDSYVKIEFGEEYLRVACDQKLYKQKDDEWIAAKLLKNEDALDGHVISVEMIYEPIDVYLLSVSTHHNFFVTRSNLCAHNFFPPVIIAISAAFGLGSVELAGLSCGIAGLGTFLGYQWHKKNKEKHKIVMEPQFYGGGMIPEDPEEEKKRKRDEAREEYKSLTRKEAKEIAKDFGHREVKDHPCGNTRNQPVFFNGKNYISPDIDGHNGGMWKVFDRRGNILHTASRRFEKIVKIYKK